MDVAPATCSIPTGGSHVSATVLSPAAKATTPVPAVLLAHGAGTDRTHASLVGWQRSLAAAGYAALLFNFPYRERGKKLPDARPVLEACWRDAIAFARATLEPSWLAIGGRSMGGRMATYVAADGVPVDALVLLGYPLHPAGKPQELRVDHLPRVGQPALFVQGTNDALANLPALRAAVATMPRATLHLLDGADHSFRIPKRSGRTDADVQVEIGATMAAWLDARRAG